MTGSHLFSPLILKDITLRNRIAVSPMCQYSCEDGFASDWHLVHLGSRAVGGAALVMVEATAVEAIGRISPGDMGLWKDEHIEPLARIARFVRAQGAVPGIQIAHAGRKGSCKTPWEGGLAIAPDEPDGWQTVAPSALPFNPKDPVPAALSEEGIKRIIQSFVAAAKRAREAGFGILEIHAAHGYLLHEFLSPLSNQRSDGYGGSFKNRIRMVLETVEAVREVWPQRQPLFVRISATDWTQGGWDDNDSTKLSSYLKDRGVDLMDCSSGGNVPHARIPNVPGYQVPFAERIKREVSILTGAVGLITEPKQADDIIRKGQADIVLLARAMLRQPYWAHHAAQVLEQSSATPVQYGRAFKS